MTTPTLVRPEALSDAPGIADVIRAAFLGHPHSDGSEPAIVERLRASNELAVSLVAEQGGRLIGHIAFSPVSLDPPVDGWFGLGPLSVHPDCQRRGVGAGLVREGLSILRSRDAAGCVVFGDLGYYGRFGFASPSPLRFLGGPAELFHALGFHGHAPSAIVRYVVAFGAASEADSPGS